MNRPQLITLSIVLAGILLVVYWQLFRFSDGQDLLVPVQTPAPIEGSDVQEESCSAAIGLRSLSHSMSSQGLDLADPQALMRLPADKLRKYVHKAVNCPEEYFSVQFGRASGQVVSAWLKRQPWTRVQPGVWRTCFKLRWKAGDIEGFSDLCRQALTPLGQYLIREPLEWADTVFTIENPDRELQRAGKRYISNPYCGEALSALALELYRKGHPDIGARLGQELLQISIEEASSLEHRKARVRGFEYRR